MVCAKCKCPEMRRIHRVGFLRETLAPKFGYYPWECSNCRNQQLLRSRGNRKRSHDAENPRREVFGHTAGQPRQSPVG
jgi:hypothetical protein